MASGLEGEDRSPRGRRIPGYQITIAVFAWVLLSKKATHLLYIDKYLYVSTSSGCHHTEVLIRGRCQRSCSTRVSELLVGGGVVAVGNVYRPAVGVDGGSVFETFDPQHSIIEVSVSKSAY